MQLKFHNLYGNLKHRIRLQVNVQRQNEDDIEKGKSSRRTDDAKTQTVAVFLKRLVIMIILSGLVAGGAAIWYYFGWQYFLAYFFPALILFLILAKYDWWYVAVVTAPRDLKALYKYLRTMKHVGRYDKKNIGVAEIFSQNAQKYPHRQAIVFENRSFTFLELEEFANKVANVFKSQGYKKGDVVALFLENKPEYIGFWLGLAKIGVIVPLINSNLKQKSLIHSITVAKSQAVIFGNELRQDILDITKELDPKLALYQFNDPKHETSDDGNTRIENINELMKTANTTVPVIEEKVGYHDGLVYIYTSGTTGLPKAAVITNARYIFIVVAIHWLAGFKDDDRFYTPLPLYHTAGGCMSAGQMLLFGSTLITRKKFSASQYFNDCQQYNATIAQYIGEMCRYVLATPPSPNDRNHNLRLIYGNGLRPQIWPDFVKRFNIPKVAEFYGATEGNANIVNVDNTVGAIGFVSRILPFVYPISIIKVDPETGEPVRDKNGLCVACKADEPGVFIKKLNPIIHLELSSGDSAFLSGDVIMADKWGNLFFMDRTGDTFRWKGENVSTSEVEAVVSNMVDYKDCVVYGVEINGQEGRAGMAAILDPENKIDLVKMGNGFKAQLPSYARPIFVRVLSKVDMTGTYKLKKNDLQKEGFNPSVIKDPLYYYDPSGQFLPLTEVKYNDINNGKIRV
ncbi:long-chain fatty acid transport protein [Holotrichia oblita]|uniref:Long-chain fatty acid transport protein n=1 Tax=Holotrichia oblita TaxID=644536 RepID=A0ACB9TCI0_HOLOL|nr:long-chain fatty acid transport protein [Holotrichia oblita]